MHELLYLPQVGGRGEVLDEQIKKGQLVLVSSWPLSWGDRVRARVSSESIRQWLEAIG